MGHGNNSPALRKNGGAPPDLASGIYSTRFARDVENLLASAADFRDQLTEFVAAHDPGTLGAELLRAGIDAETARSDEAMKLAEPEAIPADASALVWTLKRFIASVEEQLSSVLPREDALAVYVPAGVQAA